MTYSVCYKSLGVVNSDDILALILTYSDRGRNDITEIESVLRLRVIAADLSSDVRRSFYFSE